MKGIWQINQFIHSTRYDSWLRMKAVTSDGQIPISYDHHFAVDMPHIFGLGIS